MSSFIPIFGVRIHKISLFHSTEENVSILTRPVEIRFIIELIQIKFSSKQTHKMKNLTINEKRKGKQISKRLFHIITERI
jgi:hypothetical protein